MYRKRLKSSPPFFNACTSVMYEVHAKTGTFTVPVLARPIKLNFR